MGFPKHFGARSMVVHAITAAAKGPSGVTSGGRRTAAVQYDAQSSLAISTAGTTRGADSAAFADEPQRPDTASWGNSRSLRPNLHIGITKPRMSTDVMHTYRNDVGLARKAKAAELRAAQDKIDFKKQYDAHGNRRSGKAPLTTTQLGNIKLAPLKPHFVMSNAHEHGAEAKVENAKFEKLHAELLMQRPLVLSELRATRETKDTGVGAMGAMGGVVAALEHLNVKHAVLAGEDEPALWDTHRIDRKKAVVKVNQEMLKRNEKQPGPPPSGRCCPACWYRHGLLTRIWDAAMTVYVAIAAGAQAVWRGARSCLDGGAQEAAENEGGRREAPPPKKPRSFRKPQSKFNSQFLVGGFGERMVEAVDEGGGGGRAGGGGGGGGGGGAYDHAAKMQNLQRPQLEQQAQHRLDQQTALQPSPATTLHRR